MIVSYKKNILVVLLMSTSFTAVKAEHEAFKVLGALALGAVGWATAGCIAEKCVEWDDSSALSNTKNALAVSEKYRQELSYMSITREESSCIPVANKLLASYGLPNTITELAEQINSTHNSLRSSKIKLQEKAAVWSHDYKKADKKQEAENYLATIDSSISYMSNLDSCFGPNKANLILYKQKEALALKNSAFLNMLSSNNFSYTFGTQAQAHVKKHAYNKDWVYLACAELIEQDYKTLSSNLQAYNLTYSWQTYQEASALKNSLNTLHSMILGSKEYQDQRAAKQVYELQKRQAEAAERAARAAEQQARTAREQLYAAQEQNRLKQEANNKLSSLLYQLDIRKRNYNYNFDHYPAAIQQLVDRITYEIARDCNQAEIARLERELNRALDQRDMWF
jgi:chemotaxis protein histidine kinase CheA